MPKSSAIRLIQRYERARQGRVRWMLMKKVQETDEFEKLQALQKDEKVSVVQMDASALVFQRYFRGKLARKSTKTMRKAASIIDPNL